MFVIALLGLAATSTALPLAREEAKENEGVDLPIYKPSNNTYSSNLFGSQYSQNEKIPIYYFTSEKIFTLGNYDSMNISPFTYLLNYFSKYMQPEMMHMNFHDYPDMLQSFMNMRYPHSSDVNNYDYMMYKPYSYDYTYGNMENFKNMYYPYYNKEYADFNSPEYTDFKNTNYPFQNNVNKFDFMYRPYSHEYTNEYMENFKNMPYPFHKNMKDYEYMYRPYSPEYFNYKNRQNSVDSFDYMHRPSFSGYPQNFVDMSYPSNNMNGYGYTNSHNYPECMNFKNMYYPFQNKMDKSARIYKPYSPEYMYGFNMRYPYYNKQNGYDYTYRQNYPEEKYGYMRNFYMNTEYPFYNNYFGRTNNGAYELDDMKFKREMKPNVGNEEVLRDEKLICQESPEVEPADPKLFHPDENPSPTIPRLRRKVRSEINERRQGVFDDEKELMEHQNRGIYVPDSESTEHILHINRPVPRTRREGSTIVATPERIIDDLHVVPESDVVDVRHQEVMEGERELRSAEPLEHQYPTQDRSSDVRKSRSIRYTVPRSYYPYYRRTYTRYNYYPLRYSAYYYKK